MLRASAALQFPTATLFAPLIPVQVVGLVFVFTVRLVLLGRRERRRLVPSGDSTAADAAPRQLPPPSARSGGPDGSRSTCC